MEHYDLIVIGSGPAGEKAAVKAAYFGHKVAVIEKEKCFGGAGVNTGTLPSKTLKETALYLSGKYDTGLYGVDREISKKTDLETFMYRKNYVIRAESEEVHRNLLRHGIDIYHGLASFVDPHTLNIQGEQEIQLTADYFIIATGSYPVHPPHIPFDNHYVHDSDTILEMPYFPKSIAVLGAGVIGCEYATIFATMGAKVFLINRTADILSFIDQEIITYFLDLMHHDGIDLLYPKNVTEIKVDPKGTPPLTVHLESGEVLHVEMFLFAAGRNGQIKGLKLENANVTVGKRELIVVNEQYQTNVPHIYAVGDVIGFPALASTGMDQGRVAVAHIFHTKDIEQLAQVLPFGVYTVPEISCAGVSEEEAKKKSLDYAVGIAYHQDMPRGKILGAKGGMLKLIFDKKSMTVLGVHIIGPLAAELIHHGLGLIETKSTLLNIIGKVYNYPTLHDLYKYAAYDGLSNLLGHKVKL